MTAVHDQHLPDGEISPPLPGSASPREEATEMAVTQVLRRVHRLPWTATVRHRGRHQVLNRRTTVDVTVKLDS